MTSFKGGFEGSEGEDQQSQVYDSEGGGGVRRPGIQRW